MFGRINQQSHLGLKFSWWDVFGYKFISLTDIYYVPVGYIFFLE
jgi:hypothetical protein